MNIINKIKGLNKVKENSRKNEEFSVYHSNMNRIFDVINDDDYEETLGILEENRVLINSLYSRQG